MGLWDIRLRGPTMSEEMTIEERKTLQLIELREYKLLRREELKEGIISFLVENAKGEKVVILCIPNRTIGVKYVRQAKEMMDAQGAVASIIMGDGRYTRSAMQEAKKLNVELIPRKFPPFNIFKHVLVPKHVVLSPEEAEEVLRKYRVKPYQLPWIKATDPAIIAIGAKPGDIVKIIRKSKTAGEAVAYRYVVA